MILRKGGRPMFIFLCIITFVICFLLGLASKIFIQPSWAKQYQVTLTPEIGTIYQDLSYGQKETNRFDLYLPQNHTKEHYGLVVYLHAGGFTSGDKSGDKEILSWLCDKGYVAAGINYTLFNEDNPYANVYTQSLEIKEAIPHIIEQAKQYGYSIDKMAIAGGSAGHTLAMIYAYRDAKTSPIPVQLLFGAVGPSSFYVEDWDNYGFNQNTDKARQGAAELFGVMSGTQITSEMIQDQTYLEKVKHISALMWINDETVPSIVAYGKYDKVQPFKGSQRLLKAYQKHHVDYQYFVAEHSGHGLQNDNKIYHQYMQTVEAYLEKYMPVKESTNK